MALRRPRSKIKAAGGCLLLAAFIAAVLLFGPFVRDFVDTAFNPWAHSWRGGPTLTGTWVGTANSTAGRRVGVFLDLRRAEKGRGGGYSTCRHCPRIKGAARTCGGDGAQAYEVWGGPDAWGGEQFHLNVSPAGAERPGPRLRFLRGAWSGDVLRIATALEHEGEGGAGWETRFEMRRGGEQDFSALCREAGAD